MTEDFPYAAAWKDRHGRVRWRFRRGKKTVYLQGEPGSPEFQASYQAALTGLPAPARKPAEVILLPNAACPRSIRAAWLLYIKGTPDWKALQAETRARQTAIAEEFLTEEIVKGGSEIWGAMPIADLRRRHIKAILAGMSDRPHAGRHRLNVIRKMIIAALDEEWIETDPSYKINYRPETKAGFRAWTDDELKKFEDRWPLGTTPRLIYELALWLGPRRGDIARLKPSDIHGDSIIWKTGKTGTEVAMPITPSLRAALNQTDLTRETIVTTAYGEPFSIKSLTGRMQDWTEAAKIYGCTLHGLRKTLGKRIADAGGTTRMSMAALGHDDIQQAELYSEASERKMLAEEAMKKVVAKFGGKKGDG